MFFEPERPFRGPSVSLCPSRPRRGFKSREARRFFWGKISEKFFGEIPSLLRSGGILPTQETFPDGRGPGVPSRLGWRPMPAAFQRVYISRLKLLLSLYQLHLVSNFLLTPLLMQN